MYTTAAALWLDTHFAGFDHLFLSIQHWFADHLGVVLTPLMRVITLLGEKGWPFFLLALLFILLADRRDLGVCIFGAVCCGALITNIILKDNVARLRPYESGNIEYELWWMAVGSPLEDGFSFPSGHVTACAAGMTAISLMKGKKWIAPSVVVVLLMPLSQRRGGGPAHRRVLRLCRLVHHPGYLPRPQALSQEVLLLRISPGV